MIETLFGDAFPGAGRGRDGGKVFLLLPLLPVFPVMQQAFGVGKSCAALRFSITFGGAVVQLLPPWFVGFGCRNPQDNAARNGQGV